MNLLQQLETPTLLLDEARMTRNIERMQSRMNALGVRFRPHVKTSKCVDVAKRQFDAGASGITVSTLKEADEFFAAGITDILYAVAIAPTKFDHAMRLAKAGANLTLLVESAQAARLLTEHGVRHGHCHETLVEIDTDGHRSGIAPDDSALLQVAHELRVENTAGARLKGVLTHAGSSYSLNTPAALQAMAEQERAGCVRAAERLRNAGHACNIVSVGSTPTALSAEHLDGVTEVRAGVYVFFDLVMAGVGVCAVEDIALSVLCAVIGHQPSRGWIITDAGWMAMSRDRGTQSQTIDREYGLVCDIDGHPLTHLRFSDANQEHGVLQSIDASIDVVRRYPIGSQLRILPNHACSTGAQFASYRVISTSCEALPTWPRFNGW